MKVLYLAPYSSIHTQRWLSALREHFDLFIFTMHPNQNPLQGVQHFIGHSKSWMKPFLVVPEMRRYIQKIKPDLIHVHYGSSYGLLGYLSNQHPRVVTFWGDDIVDFPTRSPLHYQLIKKIVRSADGITVPSLYLKTLTDTFSPQVPVQIIPFGVDTNVFTPQAKEPSSQNKVTIGTIKGLQHVYGIDLLIRAFSQVKKKFPNIALKIAGTGPGLKQHQELCNQLDIRQDVSFLGHIPHDQVTKTLSQFDIFAAFSRRESFGVAILEASACGLPVVVSDVGGLPEVVHAEHTGLIAKKLDVTSMAQALERLVGSPELRQQMAAAGPLWVKENFHWSNNVSSMIKFYQSFG